MLLEGGRLGGAQRKSTEARVRNMNFAYINRMGVADPIPGPATRHYFDQPAWRCLSAFEGNTYGAVQMARCTQAGGRHRFCPSASA
jgi:hypothetical protein